MTPTGGTCEKNNLTNHHRHHTRHMSRKMHRERRERRARIDLLCAIAEESRPSSGIILPTDTELALNNRSGRKATTHMIILDGGSPITKKSASSQAKKSKCRHLVPRNSSKCKWEYEEGHLEVHMILKLDNAHTCPSWAQHATSEQQIMTVDEYFLK